MAIGQRDHIIGELGLGEDDRIGTGQAQNLRLVECAETVEIRGEVVRHECED